LNPVQDARLVMKKKTFKILEFDRPAQKLRGRREVAHMNKIRQMEREYDQICKKRVK